jgi:alpha-1,3-rhamnosyltransferase
MKNHNLDIPLVSVIVPAYNHEKFIFKALTSVVSQSYKNIQVIVIDDASTDGTAEIIADFKRFHKLDVIFKKVNSGLICSLNQGLTLSKGKYISLVASDDYWDSDKILKQVQLLEMDDDLKMIFCEGYEVDANGDIIQPINYSSRKIDKWKFEDVLFKADLPPASLMGRRQDFISAGGFSHEFKIDDLPIWLSLLEGGGHAKVIKEPLVYYRAHDSNMHNLFSSMVLDQHFQIIKKFSKNSPIRNKILSEWRLRNANMLAGIDNRRSLKYLLPAIYNILDYRVYSSIYKYFRT